VREVRLSAQPHRGTVPRLEDRDGCTTTARRGWSGISGAQHRPVVSKIRILVADDDPNCRELVARALGGPGTEVLTATDGGELLELTADDEHVLDLIVTDINMPWMEGLQVLASIREAGLTTPVLVITGVTRPDLETSIDRMGRARVLYKPFDVDQLRNAIAVLLGGVNA
jgi:DNA-binding response OmpR family regulator